MFAQLKPRISIIQLSKETFYPGQNIIIVGAQNNIGDISGRAPGLQRQGVPVGEGWGRHCDEFLFVAHGEGGNGERFTAIVSVSYKYKVSKNNNALVS